ncbi:non-specific lipid transfer protein GPI-anchored 19-like [Nymphaea colorata]|uniref:non-specific lipid transfer protein GPI-anchored 19-like n=1 Tax=Nymphaea colorata TaxID=210225 RepID=UPI00129EA5B7|nr:non-specific lipid transfer protein GPI-anchored 19-like [Nymphaea colorata]
MATKLGLVLVIACTLYVHAFAQSSQSGCTATIASQLASCMGYITGSSATPATSCCSGLDNVVKSQPQCLCQVVGPNAGSSLGVTVNQTLALALPGACNVKTPSPTLCSAINGAPTASPSTPTQTPPSTVQPSQQSTQTPPSTVQPSQQSVPSSPPEKPAGTPSSVTPSTNGGPANSVPSLVPLALIFFVSCVSAAWSF